MRLSNDDNNWDLIEAFCGYVGSKEDVWYATNIEIVDNFAALNNIKISVSGDIVYNPSATSVWLSIDKDIVEIKGGAQEQL